MCLHFLHGFAGPFELKIAEIFAFVFRLMAAILDLITLHPDISKLPNYSRLSPCRYQTIVDSHRVAKAHKVET